MAYKANILLGKITKVHGHEGAVTVVLEKAFTENLPDMESVFIETDGKPVPFFISSLEYPGGNILWMKFSGYESIEKVSEFAGCRIFLQSDSQEDTVSENLSSVTGFKVLSSNNLNVGTISSLIENPGQLLLEVITENGKELLLPFHEDLILSVDKRKKTIIMEIPEGLTDLNS